MAPTLRSSQYFNTDRDRKRLIDRLARVEGQLRGIQKMIASDKECEQIAQQLAAARGGLDRAFFELIACAFEAKLGGGAECPPETRGNLKELATLLAKYA